MTSPKELREEIVAALTAGGIKAAHYVGETVTPPCAVVVPAEPYMEFMPPGRSVPFGTWEVTTDVLVISHRTTAKQQADLMDDQILAVLTALDAADLDVTSVSQPGVIPLQGAKFMAAAVTVTGQLRL